MNRRLDAYLVKKCPLLFADRYRSMMRTTMCWGFECGDGWYQLLKEACLKLEPLIAEIKAKSTKEVNPFPWFIFCSAFDEWSFMWAVRHPATASQVVAKWLKGKIWPETLDPWWPRASQIKEKFGTLRFYLSSGTDEMYDILAEAEKKSAFVCERCGRPGKLRGRGWLYTACAKHVRDAE